MSKGITYEQQVLMEEYLEVELTTAGREIMLWRIVALAEAGLLIAAVILLMRS